MKKAIVSVPFVCLLFSLSACRNNPEVIETEGLPVIENNSLENQEQPSSVLFVLKDNNGFPQSQGVFDYNDGTLTVVKQYIPSRQQHEYPSIDDLQSDPVHRDFEKTFSNLTFSNDPFQVYEETQRDVDLIIGENTIEFLSDQFHKTFYFDSEDKQIVRDENFVKYTVQYE